MIENIENGMTIYFYRDLDSYIIRGKVIDSSIVDTVSIRKVAWEANIDKEGKEVRLLGGVSGVWLDRAFLTAKEANDAQEAEIEKHKEELRSEITDVESLLRFPLKHCLNGGEYTDWFAKVVYEESIEKYKKGELNV